MTLRIVLIIAASLLVYLVGNGRVSLWDRDEPRYAQTSRQMLQSGDWVVPRLLDEPREKKPVFIYWCQATAMRVFGDNNFAARLPSAIFVTATLIALAISIGRAIGWRRALWTTFIFATSALTIAAAKMSITDGVLILFVTAAQLCLYWMLYEGASWPAVIGFGLATGFGLLTKGPVVLGVNLMTCLALWAMRWFVGGNSAHRRKRSASLGATGILPVSSIENGHGRDARATTILKWIVGIALALAVVTPWLIAIDHRLPGYLWRTIKGQVIDRATTAQEGHKGPPGYYLLLVWVTYFPWSLLLPATIVHAWRRRHLPAIRFALAAIVGPWIMFELVATKLPHYMLPTFPFLAFLTADMLVRAARTVHRHVSGRGFTNIVACWGLLVIAAGSLPWISLKAFRPYINDIAIVSMVILSLLAVEYARQVFVWTRRNKPLHAATVMGGGMMLLVVVLYGGYFPNADFLRMSQRIADVLHASGARNAIMIDYKEDGLPWCEGGTIRPQRDNDFLLNNPPAAWPDWIVLTGKEWNNAPFEIQRQFEVIGEPLRPRAKKLEMIRGLEYAEHGRIVDVFVLHKK